MLFQLPLMEISIIRVIHVFIDLNIVLGKTIELCENPEEILNQAISVFVLERIEITDLMRIRYLPNRYDVIAVTESGQFFHLFEAYETICDYG